MTAADLPPSSLSSTVLAWSQGLASLSPGQPPCPGFRPDEWVETLANCRRFVDDFGPQADALGWDMITLFGCHPKSGVICGGPSGVLLPCTYPVLEARPDFMRKHLWTIPRDKPGRYRGIPVWECGKQRPATGPTACAIGRRTCL
ncbi:hypothetical protein [Methylobacterium nodulans]|uniref:Uncharacterized protein n=1 Tax=Methylobacterium nodulans (strain LMG 21967 / CNCM I-2342 / ORS 2060) TaxID=460265 RepID=B8IC25_METNO|nr:hypothetical protein [Methylobacterium nodulans]ACL61207.1 conserved hypothetical protein [Methylobacterium nodulans ORS 2060]